MPRLGIVNGHPSLLPRYRGPFPIAWAVRNGETEIGMSFHLMDAAFDTGNLLAQKAVPLGDDDTDETLFGRFPAVVARAAADRLRPARGRRPRRPAGGRRVPEHVRATSYWTIDPSQPAAEVHRQARAWSFIPPVSPASGRSSSATASACASRARA